MTISVYQKHVLTVTGGPRGLPVLTMEYPRLKPDHPGKPTPLGAEGQETMRPWDGLPRECQYAR